MISHRPELVAVATGLLATLLGFGAGISGADPDYSACQPVAAPMVDIPGTESEPQLRIPLPRGWQVSPVTDPTDTSIRMAIINPAMADSGFTPNAVAVLKTIGADGGNARRILDAQNEILQTKAGVTNLSSMPTQICGLPAISSTYTAPASGSAPPRSATSVVVVDEADDATYIASVTIQSADPGNRAYFQDAQIILDGFQVIPAA